VFTCLLAVSVFYLGCPNQQWRSKRPLNFYSAFLISLLLLVLTWGLLRQSLSVLSTIFTLASLVMLGLGLLPFTSILDRPSKAIQQKKKNIQKNLKNYQPHWWVKTLCGILMGLPLALGLAGLVAYWGPGDVVVDDKTQLVMWLITPIWLTCLSFVYLSISRKRLFTGYAGVNLLVFGLLWLAKGGV